MWDLDGVACLFVEGFYPRLREWEDLTPTEWETWHHYRTHGISDQDFVKHLHTYAEEGGFGQQEPVPGFIKAVRDIHAAGHLQCVVTDRPQIAAADTEWWIDTYAPEIKTIDIDRDKTVFKRHGGPTYYAIDDRVENVEALRKAGVFAYLLRWPWNEQSDLPSVNTLEEFVDKVLRRDGKQRPSQS